MKKIFLVILFLLLPQISQAYVITPPECQFGKMLQCVKKYRLDYVVIYDYIETEDYNALREIADNLNDGQEFPTVFLHSLGGEVNAAINIGRLFREFKVTVRTGDPVTGDVYSKCTSACVIAAAGAVKRYLVHVGLHSPGKFDEDDNLIEYPEKDYEKLKQYFDEMGMNPQLYYLIRNTPYKDLLEIEYNPNLKGQGQYLVDWGFYQGDVKTEDLEDKSPVKYTHYLKGKAATVNAALHGSRGALKKLYDEYYYGSEKQPIDLDKARVWLQIGAEQNDIFSLHNLGVWLSREKKTSQAVSYYKKAAYMGFAGSQNNYGWHLYKGDGVKQNKAEGVYWIVRAAEQGEPFAYGSLCEIYYAGDVFSVDKPEMMKWCRLATDKMPIGKARDLAVKILDKLAIKLTDDEIIAANLRVDMWQPLKQSPYLVMDKDEKKTKYLRKYY